MPNFFNNIPEEVIYKIFQKVPRPELPKLARTCKQFHRIANDPTLELSQYKNRIKNYTVGEVCLVLEENEPLFVSRYPYMFYALKNGIKVKDTGINIKDINFLKKIANAMEKGTDAVITMLRQEGYTANNIAALLNEELKKENVVTSLAP